MCTAADDLEVDVDAASNLALLTGHLKAISVTTSRICFNGFTVSGGAALYTDAIDIAVTYPGSALLAPPRLLKPFSVSVRASLTENDLNRPGPVHDGLEMMLRQIIATGLGGAIGRSLPTDIGGVTCVLDRVELSDPEQKRGVSRREWSQRHPYEAGGKLILHAHATLSSGRTFRFSVRTGLCAVNDGNIIKLSDPELLWRSICIPMTTIDVIGVKLEDTTKLTSVEIDKGKLSGDGIMVISPPPEPPKRFELAAREARETVTSHSKRHAGRTQRHTSRRRLTHGSTD